MGSKYTDQYPEFLDGPWLRHRYVDLQMDATQIAEGLGFDCPKDAVLVALRSLGIPRRPKPESSRLANRKRSKAW